MAGHMRLQVHPRAIYVSIFSTIGFTHYKTTNTDCLPIRQIFAGTDPDYRSITKNN